jgi:hypothetical protein
MRRNAERTLGLTLAAWLALSGCGDAPSPAPAAEESEASPAAEPATEEAGSDAPLRVTTPDPEALGIEGALPADVPVPPNARPMHPPLVASGTTRASFEADDSLTALQEFYKTRLPESGWSVDAEKSLDSQVLMSAKKDGRELSVAMSESAGKIQFVLLIVGE